MEAVQIAKQTIEFYKTTLDYTFDIILMLQEHTRKMLNTHLDKTAVIPDQGEKAMTGWMKACKLGCGQFKKGADESFARVESYLSEGDGSC
ncbi:MAG: hypothetical protein ACE14T_10890 [Syntrophales bacterium]